MSDHLLTLPPDLPAPEADGACDHLVGLAVPALTLASSGVSVNLAAFAAGRGVLYVYPCTGAPGRPVPEGWDAVPGARGCTPQSCGFRDHVADLEKLGARVAGLSAQTLAEQEEVAARLQLSYPVIADPELQLAAAARAADVHVRRRRALQARHADPHARPGGARLHPVFPPDRNAADVVAWLRAAA